MNLQLAEFLAQETEIEITMNRKMNQLNLLEPVGPFEMFKRQTVPLWLAILLRQKNKATIVIPDWLQVPSLQQWLQKEKESPAFQEAPFHYIEIAKLLLAHASEEMQNPILIQELLFSIKDIRWNKLRQGILQIDGNYIQVIDANVAK
jgi:hypothetical protein